MESILISNTTDTDTNSINKCVESKWKVKYGIWHFKDSNKKYSDVVVPKRIMTDTKTEKDVVVKSWMIASKEKNNYREYKECNLLEGKKNIVIW